MAVGWTDAHSWPPSSSLSCVDRGGQDRAMIVGSPLMRTLTRSPMRSTAVTCPGQMFSSSAWGCCRDTATSRDRSPRRRGRLRGCTREPAAVVEFQHSVVCGSPQQVDAGQVGHVARSRSRGHFGGCSGLDDLSVLDDDHPVAERHGVEQVVGDEHVSQRRSLAQDARRSRRMSVWVETSSAASGSSSSRRLRIGGQGSGQRDALGLPTGDRAAAWRRPAPSPTRSSHCWAPARARPRLRCPWRAARTPRSPGR